MAVFSARAEVPVTARIRNRVKPVPVESHTEETPAPSFVSTTKPLAPCEDYRQTDSRRRLGEDKQLKLG